MTPLGHASVSYLVSKTSRRFVPAAVVVGGVIPDIDFLLLPLPAFNSFHRVATHSIFFVAAVGLVVFFLTHRRLDCTVSFVLGAALHLFCDSIIDTNPSNGIGIAILWPITGAMWSPFNIATPIEGGVGWRDAGEMMGRVRRLVPYEAAFWLAGLILFVKSRIAKADRNGTGSVGAAE